ncbi:hypothetical protein ACOMHN_044952 [Nucella lapillus]
MAKQSEVWGSGYFVSTVIAVLLCYHLASVVAEVELAKGTEILNQLDPKHYKDCREAHEAGYNISGVYMLHMNAHAPFNIHCEFTNGGAYNLIQCRKDNNVNFMQPMAIYQKGFGYQNGDFWIGLDIISHLTMSGNRVLTIVMQNYKGVNSNVRYTYFNVQPSSYDYTMTVTGFSSHPALLDDLGHSTGMKFYTYDKPDIHGCASQMKGGWWYNYCAYAMLNGYYYPPGPYTPAGTYFDGVFWESFGGYNNSLRYVSMSVSSS